MLLLQPQNTEILGGAVQELCEELNKLQMNRKSKREPSVRPEDIIQPPTKRAAYPSITGTQPVRSNSTNSLIDQDSSTDTAEKLQPVSSVSNYFHKTPKLLKHNSPATSTSHTQDFSRRKSDSSTELVVDLVDESPSEDYMDMSSVKAGAYPRTPPVSYIQESEDGLIDDEEVGAFLASVESDSTNFSSVKKEQSSTTADIEPSGVVDLEFLVDQRSTNTKQYTTRIRVK